MRRPGDKYRAFRRDMEPGEREFREMRGPDLRIAVFKNAIRKNMEAAKGDDGCGKSGRGKTGNERSGQTHPRKGGGEKWSAGKGETSLKQLGGGNILQESWFKGNLIREGSGRAVKKGQKD